MIEHHQPGAVSAFRVLFSRVVTGDRHPRSAGPVPAGGRAGRTRLGDAALEPPRPPGGGKAGTASMARRPENRA